MKSDNSVYAHATQTNITRRNKLSQHSEEEHSQHQTSTAHTHINTQIHTHTHTHTRTQTHTQYFNLKHHLLSSPDALTPGLSWPEGGPFLGVAFKNWGLPTFKVFMWHRKNDSVDATMLLWGISLSSVVKADCSRMLSDSSDCVVVYDEWV